MNLQLFGNGGTREQGLRNAMLAALTETTSQLASTLYTHTWKTRTTPDGNQIISLRASPRKGKAGLSPWEKTPQASDGDGGVMEVRPGADGKYKLRDYAALASWPTPQANNAERGGSEQRATNPERSNDLHDFALLASWPTPMAGTPAQKGYNEAGNTDSSRKMVELTSWATPSSRDWKDTPGMAETGVNPDGTERTRLDQLPRQANLAAWPTPNAMEGGQTSRSGERKDEMLMGGMVQTPPDGPARLTISGKMLIGSDAGMGNGGQLWPGLPRFLMGLPVAWCQAAIAAHRKMKSAKKKPPQAKRG